MEEPTTFGPNGAARFLEKILLSTHSAGEIGIALVLFFEHAFNGNEVIEKAVFHEFRGNFAIIHQDSPD